MIRPSVGLGEAEGETVGGIGRLISGGLSNRHSVGEGCPFQHAHTHFYTVIALSPSLSHLVISWSEPFPWRTIAVEMDYDYKG